MVLGYIANSVRRFHVFVANSVQEIQDKTSIKQWKYVDTKTNLADEASRGLRARELTQSKWIPGPDFLWKPETEWNVTLKQPVGDAELLNDDPEVKKIVSLATAVTPSWSTMVDRLTYFSDWQRAMKAVAMCRRYVRLLQSKIQKRNEDKITWKLRSGKRVQPISTQELHEAEVVILKAVQQEFNPNTSPSSPLGKLDPYKDSNGVIRVGGRLNLLDVPGQCIHPAILPKTGLVNKIVIRYYYHKVRHQGGGITTNEIRASGFWIVGATSAVSSAIRRCVACRKLRGKLQEQRMAELPHDRLETVPPFTNCAVYYFGPFVIREGRKDLKRYGVLFTCMASRAVHVEVVATLETDSFINAFRRFISRRGPIRQLRSDHGTNFVGARRELKVALEELDHDKIRSVLQRHDCDWFVFKMNVPSASHMGGVWERQIRSVRPVVSIANERFPTQP